MANNPSVSEVVDKDGVIADIEAKRFDGTRTFTLQGDVSGTQTWNGDSSTAMTLNVSIGAKKVTQDKIGDKAVGTGQIADGAVGLTQIDPSAMTSTATSGDNRLITSGGVRTEIDNAMLNRGKDYGPMTPTQINAISETIPTGSTVHVTAAGTITDGDIEVRNGEDLKYYSGNGTHYWYSMDGEFKLKQTAIPGGQGSTTKTLTGIAQDENGVMSPTFGDIQEASTSQKGLVQLAGSVGDTVSSENNKAASEKAVRDALDALKTDIQSEYKPKQTAVTDPAASGDSYSFIASYSQDANGVSTVEKKTIPDASPSESGVGGAKGLMSASDKEKLDDLASGEATKDKDEVIAAALDDLDARMGAVEDTLKEENLGTRTADEIDSQVLKIGGDDVAALLAGKVDKVEGKGLSKNDFTDAYKSAVDANTSARHTHSNKSVLDGISSSDITNWNGKQSALTWMTNDEVDALWDNAYAAAVAG